MADLTYPYSIVAGDTPIAGRVQGNFDAIRTLTNSSGWVTDAKLASPNNSVYRSLASAQGKAMSAGTGTYFICSEINQGGGPTNHLAPSGTPTTNDPPQGQFRFTSSDYSTSLTTKFRVNMQVGVGSTSPSTVTFTAGLYPLTISGGNWTLGPVVTGSTVVSSGLGTNNIHPFASADFSAAALLTDPGQYVVGVAVGSILVPSGISLALNLQQHHTP